MQALEDPAFVASLRGKLGLPSEPIAQALRDLAEAQGRTEQRIEQLAEAERRTEQRMDELAQALERTAEQVALLARAMVDVRKEVGALSATVGAQLEEDVL